MAKATITLANGTIVSIEAEPEELEKIISLYSSSTEKKEEIKKIKTKTEEPVVQENNEINLSILVNTYKSSDEAELIDRNILDRSSVVDRILLPLYLIHNYIGGEVALTSGEISKFLGQININIFQPNVAKALSTTASKYVIGDKTRKKGQAVKYRLSRRGVQYMNSVIKGNSNE